MKNITISVSEDVYRTARVRAAELDTTVTGLVRSYLESLTPDGDEFRRLERLQDDALGRIHAAGGLDMSENLSRTELHDRALQRTAHERARS